MQCHFCNHDLTSFEGQKYRPTSTLYHCSICGEIRLTKEAAADYDQAGFSDNQKKILSIVLRNEYERRGKKPPLMPFTLDDLHQKVKQYHPMDPLEKIDSILLNLDKASRSVDSVIPINWKNDYSYYYCSEPKEFIKILKFLSDEKFLIAGDKRNIENGVIITPQGYQRLKKLKQFTKDSRQCCVAMWSNREMLNVYEQAIQPAIEYIEEGAAEPRFRAVRVDNVEDVNDINDEIIAQIRRSRFMVCDLTGYRGGVYFESGFAHGLGLPVIYTCRKDWCDEDKLMDDDGKIVEFLKDSHGRPVQVKKEGVHFDLAHRNRIEWEIDKLDEFKVKLENSIKVVIV